MSKLIDIEKVHSHATSLKQYSNLNIIKNISLFSNAGVGEYGTSKVYKKYYNKEYKVQTVIANEIIKERAKIYKANYPYTNMIVGSITDKNILSEIVKSFNVEQPQIGTFTPPCQASSGLNAHKGKHDDHRNQLIKSVFQMFNAVENNSIEIGYIENIPIYYKQMIPAYIKKTSSLFHDYIVDKNNGTILNYNYFLLCKKVDYDNLLMKYAPDASGHMKEIDDYDTYLAFDNLNDASQHSIELHSDHLLVSPITIKDYISQSMQSFGYSSELKLIRSDEYGGAQRRERGFFLFFKEHLDIQYPKKIYANSSEKYNGKTILHTLKVCSLIKEFTTQKEAKKFITINKNKLFSKEIFRHENKYYVDTAISIKTAHKEFKKFNDGKTKAMNFHFSEKLSKRYTAWIENTPEGQSAFANKERHHRPYKIYDVLLDSVKRNNEFVIEEDSIQFFEKYNVIEYRDFISRDMIEKHILELQKGKEFWMLASREDRDKIQTDAIAHAKKLSRKTGELYRVFLPIKGFAGAIYKRGTLNLSANTLSTVMNFGNSNTVHPIFNRTWTTAEVQALFGIGLKYEGNRYIKSEDFIIPRFEKKSLKGVRNLIYEITGEAIIATVAKTFLDSVFEQFIKSNCKMINIKDLEI